LAGTNFNSNFLPDKKITNVAKSDETVDQIQESVISKVKELLKKILK